MQVRFIRAPVGKYTQTCGSHQQGLYHIASWLFSHKLPAALPEKPKSCNPVLVTAVPAPLLWEFVTVLLANNYELVKRGTQ